MNWFPHVTVATLVEMEGKFLLVQELSDGQTVLNQPAGHLEQGETMLQAAVRETLEETQWHVALTHVLGMALYTSPNNGITYFRTTFVATPVKLDPDTPLDEGIECARWLTLEEIHSQKNRLRSPMVLTDIERYLRGDRFPLEIINSYKTADY